MTALCGDIKLTRGGPARLAAFVAVALLLASTISLTGSRAVLAGPPCYDTSCNYLDPQNEGCATNAITIDYIYDNYYIYVIDLRWESYCGANWAKAANDGCDSYGNCISAYYFQSYKNNVTLGTEAWFDDSTAYQAHWSYMLSGASSSDRVCLYENWNDCTAWH